MERYVTCLLFTPDGGEVLTQMVAVGPDSGKFNGISCIDQDGSHPNVAGVYGIAMETGLDIAPSLLTEICTIDLPAGTVANHLQERVVTHFYAAIVVDKSRVSSQPGRNPLTWMPPKKLDAEPELFVDEGSLQYATHLAIKKLKLANKATRVRFRPQFL